MYSVKNPFYFLSMNITFTDILPWFCNQFKAQQSTGLRESVLPLSQFLPDRPGGH